MNLHGIRLSFVFLLVLALVATPVPAQGADLSGLLPGPKDFPGWRQAGPPESAQGEDLFKLINGGAESYLRPGFSRAVIATYLKGDSETITLEIYEMTSAGGAKTVFEEKAGDGGQKTDLGQEGRIEDYYLVFRRGRFFVTLTGYDSTPRALEALTALARIIDQRLRDR